MTIADRIKEQRMKKRMSQEEMAKQMGLKSKTSISRIENSGDDITLKVVQRAAVVLDCSPLYLMGWIDYNNVEDRAKRLIHYYNMLSAESKSQAESYIEFLIKKEGDEE